MLNKCIIMGRLVRDPELRRTQSGTAVCSFTLAVDRDYTPKGGAKEADFVNVVAWRHTAEFVAKYFAKGRMAVASGSLQSRAWMDKNDNKRIEWEVIADNVYFGDSKASSGYSKPDAGGVAVSGEDFADFEEDDGEGLPF